MAQARPRRVAKGDMGGLRNVKFEEDDPFSAPRGSKSSAKPLHFPDLSTLPPPQHAKARQAHGMPSPPPSRENSASARSKQSTVFPPTPTSNARPTRQAESYFATPTRPSRNTTPGPVFDPSIWISTEQASAAYPTPTSERVRSTTKGSSISTARGKRSGATATAPPPVAPLSPPPTPPASRRKTTTRRPASATATSASTSTSAQPDTPRSVAVPEEWLRTDAKGKFKLPKGFSLKSHQVISREWMAQKERDPMYRGGILADDMGLGKTLQTMVMILDDKVAYPNVGPTLIVCPQGVMVNWLTDFAKLEPNTHFTDFKITEYHGAKRVKDVTKLMKNDIVITSFGILASEFKGLSTKKPQGYVPRSEATSGILAVNWRRVVVDEAHTFRNPATQTYAACMALKSERRWCLSGTPIQNTIEDLYSLFSFLRLRDRAPSIPTAKKMKLSAEQIAAIRVFLVGFMLRRLKNDKYRWTDLPEPIRKIVHCEFGADEQRFYDLVEAGNAFTVWGRSIPSFDNILVKLLRRKQACLLPQLVYENLDPEETVPEALPEGAQAEDLADDSDVPPSPPQVLDIPKIKVSTKMRKLADILKEIEQRSGNEKTVVFSEFPSFLDHVAKYLRTLGYRTVQYDGRMSVEEKSLALEKIVIDPETTVMLVSLKAGGTGLNLTSCNNVILLDVWWNPAIEEQAVNRVHRIGQDRPVYVYKVVIPGTVEDKILEKQDVKSKLAVEVLEEKDIVNQRLMSGLWGR